MSAAVIGFAAGFLSVKEAHATITYQIEIMGAAATPSHVYPNRT
jgi:hypothetical protein